MMMFLRLSLVLALTVSLTTPLIASPFRDGIVVFGDSLTDTGFFNSVTDGAVPGPGYTDGRFSNGPVWIEHLANALGHSDPLPPTLGGTNYAFGAGMTHSSLDPTPDLVHMDQQVGMYLDTLSQSPGRPPRHDLFVLWGGANDFMRADPNTPIDPVASAQNIGQYIEQLYNVGGRNFLVGDLPQLGNVPATVHDPEARDALNSLSSAFNSALAQVLLDLEQLQGLNLYRLPAADLFDAAWAGELGFSNVDEPAVPGLEPGAPVWGDPVPNPDEYMFWDAIHPSAAMHEFIGEAAFDAVDGLGPRGWYRVNAIPEPTSGTLVIGAAMMLLARRRRRAHS
ncbi:SGNH/GDSL hydrolase family protein [Phycisphaerales bacterium AB-hyl4]|uniref:SGNH/GDSL hydrolase family protein n=1 Tax=Natronomicrosphaera hydrolytica TaxID=3242702 RepID=A0ABV4TZZ9_9BACT